MRRWSLAVMLVLAACEGTDPPRVVEVECAGRAPLRRLDRLEYDNTVRDLLGLEDSYTSGFPADPILDGFNNQADGQVSSRLRTEHYMIAAEQLAGAALEQLGDLLPCEPGSTTESEAECAAQFIASFGQRAYRRPLSAEQHESLLATYTRGREQDGSFEAGIRWVIERVLQSPQFLYHLELEGERAVDLDGDAVVALDDWELASRLSYFLWRSMPDERLFDLAAAGELHSAEAIEVEARRMLEDPRARATVLDFHRQWLDLHRLDETLKSSLLYPEFGPSLRASMATSIDRYVEHVVFEGQGTLTELLLADYAFVDAKLAKVYEVPHSGGLGFERAELPGDQRRGLLTQAGLLAGLAKADESSPVRRGRFVRERLLCDPLSPPPAGLVTSLPPLDPDTSTRERFEQHTSDPSCAGCHQNMDPIGFGFEHYDAIGRFRTEQAGEAIDASGQVVNLEGSGDVDFDGALELANLLAGHAQVEACYARQWFRYGLGRHEDPLADACSLDGIEAALRDSDGDIHELLLAVVRSDAFMVRSMEGLE